MAGFDRTHTFQLYHVYQLPFGKGQKLLSHGVLAQIVGGFQIGGTLSRFSGIPFSVIASNASCNCPGQQQTANQISPTVKILGGHDPNSPYFDGSAFGPVTTASLGTTGRNILRGPGLFNIDENISRTFSFKDGKIRLQLVGEAFNLTNTPTFNIPGSTSGFVGSTWAAPTLNGDSSVKSYGNYSVISSTASTARQLQVGGYVRF